MDIDYEELSKKIKRLRKEGKKLSEISKITGKSIYFIYSIINPNYRLRQLEIDYIKSKVIPALKKKGFRDIYIPIENKPFWADIVAKKEKTYHIFEVKKNPQSSLLCFAVGEIILNRQINEENKHKKEYHIILPRPKEKWRERKMKEQSNFLKKNYKVDIIFI